VEVGGQEVAGASLRYRAAAAAAMFDDMLTATRAAADSTQQSPHCSQKRIKSSSTCNSSCHPNSRVCCCRL
jgi:hypothetical protein